MEFIIKLWSLKRAGMVSIDGFSGWVIEGIVEVEKIWRALNSGEGV